MMPKTPPNSPVGKLKVNCKGKLFLMENQSDGESYNPLVANSQDRPECQITNYLPDVVADKRENYQGYFLNKIAEKRENYQGNFVNDPRSEYSQFRSNGLNDFNLNKSGKCDTRNESRSSEYSMKESSYCDRNSEENGFRCFNANNFGPLSSWKIQQHNNKCDSRSFCIKGQAILRKAEQQASYVEKWIQDCQEFTDQQLVNEEKYRGDDALARATYFPAWMETAGHFRSRRRKKTQRIRLITIPEDVVIEAGLAEVEKLCTES